MFPALSLPLIAQKTGIQSRYYADDDETTSDLGAKAALSCLTAAKISPQAIDALILGTSTPDRLLSATGPRVQHLIGATNAFAFDVNSVCSGAVYAMDIGDALIRSERCQRVLIVAAEVYSRFLNPKDFSTYPYFGDGAGAVLLEATDDSTKSCILGSILRTDGKGWDVIQIPGGGASRPFSGDHKDTDCYFTMVGREVFDFAVAKGSEVVLEVLKAVGAPVEAVDHVVTHQANIHIIDQIAKRTGIPRGRFVVNLDRVGNTAGASVLIALDEMRRSGGENAGELVVLAAFGGGLSWGATAVRF